MAKAEKRPHETGLHFGSVRLWLSFGRWGLLNVSWGEGHEWGIHLLCLHPYEWYWGKFDEEYDRVVTYWGLGPLGFVSRLNS